MANKYFFLKVEVSKLNIRILPKISPFFVNSNPTDASKQPFSQAQNVNSGSTNQLLSSKIITQKQLNHFDILTNRLMRKIDYEMNDLNQLIIKLISTRTKWQQYSQ